MLARHAAVVVGLTLGLMSANAQATPITKSYDFDATFAAGSPYTDLSGTFTVTYDLATSTGGSVDAFSSNLPLDYLPVELSRQDNFLIIGDNCGVTTCSATGGRYQFYFVFDVFNDGSFAAPFYFTYTHPDYASYSWSQSFSVTVSSVPLPASAPMFGAALLGLAGLGYGAKRSRTTVA